MPKLLDLPIAGQIKRDFENFFDKTNSNIQDWEFDQVTKFSIMDIEMGKLKDVSDNCYICDHVIKNICVFRLKKDYSETKGLGVCCASNLMAMQQYGSIENLNFERQVKLEKKTLLKRWKEYQFSENKKKIQTENKDIIEWLDNFLDSVKKEMPELVFNPNNQDIGIYEWNRGAYEDIFRRHLDFFLSVRNSIDFGHLSEAQANAIRQSMKENNIERRILNIKNAVNWENEKRKQEQKGEYAKMLLGCFYERNYGGNIWFVISVWDKHREFILSLLEQWKAKRFFSDKQIESIIKLHQRYHKNCDREDLSIILKEIA